MSPNRLAAEKSPYLLQHKGNPVDWFPWGDEAFRAAKKRDVPLILSIGYSTCHWCHVMERESFSDEKVATAMNNNFVCVKLDREERPDVDTVYMAAVQAMTGQGGWPLNVFLTPALKPFFGGTYFPPTARWGQPGWIELLARISELWTSRRGDIESDASKLTREIERFLSVAEGKGAPVKADIEKTLDSFRGAFDRENGGFGGAPKFPMPANQRFLLRRHARTGEADALAMAVDSLRAMVRGGIFDQIGGGFARYSTDEQWRVPHFEKMLYDNAQLLENLADAALATRDQELELAVRRTVAYLELDLRSEEGGFYCAEDADSLPVEFSGAPAGGRQKEEGAFYLWTREEIRSVLGGEADVFCERYGIQEEGKSIPYDKNPNALTEPRAAAARELLLEARSRRPRPSRDEKILSSWNGLALTGLSRAYLATADRRALELAVAAAEFLRRECASEDGKKLWHRWCDSDRAVSGFSDDYAFVAQGLIDLYEASFDPRWLSWALDLAESAISRFSCPDGGLFQVAADEAPELFARAVEDRDGVEPAASSVLAEAALRLHELTGRAGLRDFAERTFGRFGPRAIDSPLSMPYLLCALDRSSAAPQTLMIADFDRPGGAEILALARSRLRPDLNLAGFTHGTKKALAALIPYIQEIPDFPKARAYLCVGRSCGLPIEDCTVLARHLDLR